MIIPPQHLANRASSSLPIQGVSLESSHICLGREVVAAVFQEELNIYLTFYPEKGHLVMAPVTNTFFTTLHKASQHLLKIKSADGARSIALHELIIDHEIEQTAGPLRYEIIPTTQLLKVYLK